MARAVVVGGTAVAAAGALVAVAGTVVAVAGAFVGEGGIAVAVGGTPVGTACGVGVGAAPQADNAIAAAVTLTVRKKVRRLMLTEALLSVTIS